MRVIACARQSSLYGPERLQAAAAFKANMYEDWKQARYMAFVSGESQSDQYDFSDRQILELGNLSLDANEAIINCYSMLKPDYIRFSSESLGQFWTETMQESIVGVPAQIEEFDRYLCE